MTREEAQFLNEIREAIIEGKPLPFGSYRSNHDTTPDKLLKEHGIMHLHLCNAGSKNLLYLVQYEKLVVFLEVSDHYAVDSDPIGGNFSSIHEGALIELEESKEFFPDPEPDLPQVIKPEGWNPRMGLKNRK